MRLAKTFFVATDKLLNKPQNPRRLEKNLTDVTTLCDIVYCSDYPDMSLDIHYVPRDDGLSYPVIFEIHGGGFAAGDKKYRRVLCKYYSKQTGAFVVNVNYGVGSENAFPLPIKHLVAAANWVWQNAEKYNLDLSRFVVTGDSAGAYYSAFLCALQGSEKLQRKFECAPNAHFTAGVFNCGLYDLEYALQKRTALNRSICQEFTGLTMEQASEKRLFDDMSVTNYVTDRFPPSLIIYSTHDVFCKGQAELLLQQLEIHNVPAEKIVATRFKDNHVYSLMWSTKMAVATNKQIIYFINRHLYGDVAENPQTESIAE